MKFEEALQLMREGKKVWLDKGRGEPSNYFFCGIGEIMCYNLLLQDYNPAVLDSDAIMSKEWKEYKQPILNDVEKKYLESVLRPFRGKVAYVLRNKSSYSAIKEYLYFVVKGDEPNFNLPYFTAGSMYKGMELGRRYTLEELGLFEKED